MDEYLCDLPRRTALSGAADDEARRVKRSPLKRGQPPKRKTRLRQQGRKVEREKDALAVFRLELKARGWCEAQGMADSYGQPVCGQTRLHRGSHAHHVWPEDRDRGVHDPARALFLCSVSHSWAHTHPADAKRLGLL